MKLIDLSQPVYADCPNCPDDPPPRSELIADHSGQQWRVEQLQLTSHTGTHIDAPLHRLPRGKSIDALPLESFVGEAVIADLRDSRPGMPFTSSWLSRRLRTQLEDKIILLATGWGTKRGKSEEWLTLGPYVSPDGAEWLVEQNVRGVGIDHCSIGGVREPQNGMAHDILLKAGVWILEDLRFPPEVFTLPQTVKFWCLPIHLRGFSAAFCRPVIVVDT